MKRTFTASVTALALCGVTNLAFAQGAPAPEGEVWRLRLLQHLRPRNQRQVRPNRKLDLTRGKNNSASCTDPGTGKN